MKRPTLCYWIDAILFVLMVGTVFIGLVLGFMTQEGPASEGATKYFLGLHRHQWGEIHFWYTLLFTLFLIIHLIRKWDWIRCQTRALFKRLWPLWLIVLVSLGFVAAAWWAMPQDAPEYEAMGRGRRASDVRQAEPRGRGAGLSAERPQVVEAEPAPADEDEAGHRHEAHEDLAVAGREAEAGQIVITGRMSLAEVAQETGVSVEDIIAALELPATVSRRENLGRLRRIHGFTMTELREALDRLMKKE